MNEDQIEKLFKIKFPGADFCRQSIFKIDPKEKIQTTLTFPIVIGGNEVPRVIEMELQDPIRYDGNFGVKQDVILTEEKKRLTVKTNRLVYDQWPTEIILLSEMEPHVNVIELINYSKSIHKSRMNIFLECIGPTLRNLIDEYKDKNQHFPYIYVKTFMVQLLRGLGHLHSYKICHRSILPEKIVINKEKMLLKITDLECSAKLPEGKAKFEGCELTHYVAPELLLRACYYDLSIDIWSVGCILGELLNKNNPLISGSTEVEVFHSIKKLLGSPKFDDVKDMGFPKDVFYILIKKKRFPTLRKYVCPWCGVFIINNLRPPVRCCECGHFLCAVTMAVDHRLNPRKGPPSRPTHPTSPEITVVEDPICSDFRPEEIEFLEELLQYSPMKRPAPLSLLDHKFFLKLRDPTLFYPDDEAIPELFKFTERELEIQPELERICTNHT